MRTGSTLVRVLPNPAGGWDVREPGSVRALGHAAERNAAVLRAQALMLSGGVVQLLDEAGVLVKTYTVPDPRQSSWWYVPPLPLSWAVGGLFTLQGAFTVATHQVDEAPFWLGLAMGLAGVLYLALAARSRRRNRRLILSQD